ncbi:hypothetical protein FGO68_gene8598 [Halteria grandinella]|uniref:Uncharacterized protein n=1 Tax=Halteria grandinella TaxID=5974 RepID=A0A8J8TA77_HALGN|nr:hypothetical protein FGO68_gene8598 [Halteria grandinella]
MTVLVFKSSTRQPKFLLMSLSQELLALYSQQKRIRTRIGVKLSITIERPTLMMSPAESYWIQKQFN